MYRCYEKDIFVSCIKDLNSNAKSRQRRVYHQCKALYFINTQGNTRWHVMRYKGGKPPLMIYAALRASMICQACGLDKKIRQVKSCRIFCIKATKKIFFAFLNKDSNSNGYFFLKLARVTGTVNMSPWEPHHVDVATTQPFCSFISLANFFIPIL